MDSEFFMSPMCLLGLMFSGKIFKVWYESCLPRCPSPHTFKKKSELKSLINKLNFGKDLPFFPKVRGEIYSCQFAEIWEKGSFEGCCERNSFLITITVMVWQVLDHLSLCLECAVGYLSVLIPKAGVATRLAGDRNVDWEKDVKDSINDW